MAKEIVALNPDDKRLLVEVAGAMTKFEEDIAQKWDDLYAKARNGLREKDRAVKNYKEAVRLLLTSLSDGDFEGYFNRIDERGADFAKTKEQYENLILSFHLYEEASFPYLQSSFTDRISLVLNVLDHLYHNVIALLARAYFRELERDREKFVNILAHDLKNPLMSIIGFSNLIVDRNREGTLSKEKENSYLKIIRDNGNRILRLIDSTLDYGKLKSGKFILSPARVNLSEIAREASFSLLPAAEKAGIAIFINGRDLKEEMGQQHPIEISADRDLILRAVGNYLSNAVKYARSKVSVSMQDRGEDILISVEDDGAGIPQNEINLIFEDYYMAEGGKPGTGLGLPSVRMIAELHNGKAWVESEVGKGSTFYLRLTKKQEK